jgi:tetratricopeptide (TPR) repeat protein
MARSKTTAPDNDQRFAPLSDDDIRQQTDEGSFGRGRSYFRNGHIVEPIRRGDTIEARCIGSEPAPYRVTATLAPAGDTGGTPKRASCTCPRGGFCKHIVALLLTWIDDPSRVTALPPVAEQLAGRSREELIALIERMLHRDPDLQRLIELPLPPVPGATETVPANALTVDTDPIRRQIRAALAEYDPYDRGGWDSRGSWGEGGEVPEELATIQELGERYADAGQWANAQAVATALIEETLAALPTIDDESGDILGIVNDPDAVLARCLTAQAELPEDQRLAPDQRDALTRTIYEIWRADAFVLGGVNLGYDSYDALIHHATADERSAVEGWLRAEEPGDWTRSSVTGFLVDLREASGASDEELLELYREAELWSEVTQMLLAMGRVDDAISTAARHLRLTHEVTAFADALIREQPQLASRAITLVDDLLWEIEGKNAGHDDQLQAWLERQYAAHGREQDALNLARRRFERTPNVSAYNEMKRIARLPGQPEGTWSEVRPELLLALKSRNAWADLIRIHLAAGEGMAALEALDTLKEKQKASRQLSPFWSGGIGGGLAVSVAAAIERDAPDRAIELYRAAADQAIAMKNRGSYQTAADHLARVKTILEREGRGDEWKAAISALRDEHMRLPALQDELNKRKLI